MTIREIQKKYSDKRKELEKREAEALKARLKEINLGGLVKHKRSGDIGWLCVDYDDYEYPHCHINFYPRTETGEKSETACGWYLNIETDYEPYKKGGAE